MANNRTVRKYRRQVEPDGTSPLALGAMGIAAAALGAATAWIVYSNTMIDHAVFLPNAIPADRRAFRGRRAGNLSYYVDESGEGRPLVLIHSVNAAASAYEMGPLFDYYRGKRPVYALDLPGFGFSDRPDREYTPQLYADAIADFLETQVGEAADVVALSLGSEFACRAALMLPERFNSLALISPTGLGRNKEQTGSQQAGQSGASRVLYPLFSFSLWGRPFYDLLTTRRSIRYFLEKSFIGPVPPEMVAYDSLTAHQPGAVHAPLHFITGKLFTPNARRQLYEQVATRTLVIYDRDNFTSFEMLPELLANNLRWAAVRIVPTLGLPHWEQLLKTVETLNNFWDGNIS